MTKTPTYYAKKAERLAIQKRIEKKPFCYSCGAKATTAHHDVPKSLSNFLRCSEKNLVPICNSCHFTWHNRSDPEVRSRYKKNMEREFGKEWEKDLFEDRRKFIKNTVSYWKQVLEELQ